MKLEIDLKDERLIEFLKEFANNHYPGSDNNLYTDRPIHLVQTKEYVYAPYDGSTFGEYDEWEMCFIDTYDYDVFETELELLEFNEIENAKSFEELRYKELELNGGSYVIYDYEDYFEYYGIKDYDIVTRKHYWQTRAYFLIREQAEEYKKYQAHNLGESRIYTDSYGYSNCGEWTKFYDLLLHMGSEVNKLT